MSDDDLVDPMQHTIDEIRVQFEKYKLSCAREIKSHEQKVTDFCLDAELKDLRSDVQRLRLDLEQLQQRSEIREWNDDNAIEDLASSLNEFSLGKSEQSTTEKDGSTGQEGSADEGNQNKESPEQAQNKLVISCGSSPCLFDNCHRLVDSQLLLLHYLCDHNDGIAVSQRCQKIYEGQRIVLSFDPKSCQFKQNRVLGLLLYGGSLIKGNASHMVQRPEINNSFPPEKHAHLEGDVPVVVLICKTAATDALRDKLLARRAAIHADPKDQVYVIWLVTPYERLQLHATLKLCGRDAAAQASSIVAVRQVRHSQDTCRFMPVDANYWRLSFTEMQIMSNSFKDEMHLEISLAELSPMPFV